MNGIFNGKWRTNYLGVLMFRALNKVRNANKRGFSCKDLIRELDGNTQNACGNCTLPAAAVITYRRSATPGRLCGNPEITEVENSTAAAWLKEDARL